MLKKQKISSAQTAAHTPACKMIVYELTELYPDWAAMCKTACVLPMSSVPAERGFSLRNGNKMTEMSPGRGKSHMPYAHCKLKRHIGHVSFKKYNST